VTITVPPAAATDRRRQLLARVEWVRSQRAAGDDLVLEGYAAVFDSQSEDIGFREVLAPGCFRRALSRSDADPLLLWAHDTAHPLARRSAGNLELAEDTRGLHFRARMVPTQVARDAALLVGSGVVRGVSFGFTVAPGGDEWSHRGSESLRRINEIDRLFEISLVAEPAYADTSVEPAVREARSRLAAVEGGGGRLEALRMRAVSVRPVDPYGPDSPHSWFRDIYADEENHRTAEALRTESHRLANKLRQPARTWANVESDMEPDAVRDRVQSVRERRDLSTSSGAAAFVPAAGVPGFIADLFALSAHDAATVAALLPHRELPRDMNVRTPQFTGGALMAVQASGNAAVTEADPATSQASSPVTTVAGQVDAAIQLIEQSRNADQALAVELGAAWGEQLEAEVIAGAGTGGHTVGLLSVPSVVTGSYTSASPTQAGAVTASLALRAAVFAALRRAPSVAVMHPRRRTWLYGWFDSAGAQVRPDLLATEVESTGIPTDLGDGSDEDVILYLQPDELPLFMRPPSIRAMTEPGSGTLTVRFTGHGYIALLANRKPAAIGKLAGTGLNATL
jgi:HK97 family phage prohead protease/HK97 family phage major capsid protein